MNNRKQFILDSNSLKIKEVLNKDFLEVELYAISEGENVNRSNFTLTSMEKSIPTFYNKFILGYFNTKGGTQEEGNFEEHNSDVKYDKEYDEYYYSYTSPNAEKALGIIRESDTVEIVEYKGKKWIKLTAALLTKYNREAVKHLLKSKRKRKISVEITIEKYHTDKNGIDIIEEFTLDGITILGNRKNSSILCEEGIKGAEMRILNFLETEVFNTQKKALSFAYSSLDAENQNEQKDEVEMQQKIKEMEGKPMIETEQQVCQEETLEKEGYSNNEDIFVSETTDEETQCKNSQEDKKEECSSDNTQEDIQKDSDDIQKDVDNEQDDEDCLDKEECSEEQVNHNKQKEDNCNICQNDELQNQEEECNYEKETKTQEEVSNQGTDEEVFVVEYAFGKVTCDAIVRDNLTELITNYTQIQSAYETLKNEYNSLVQEVNRSQLLQFGLKIIANEDILTSEEINCVNEQYTKMCNNDEFSSESEAENYLRTKFAEIAYNNAKTIKQNEQKEFSAKIPSIKVEKEVEQDSFAQLKKMLNL